MEECQSYTTSRGGPQHPCRVPLSWGIMEVQVQTTNFLSTNGEHINVVLATTTVCYATLNKKHVLLESTLVSYQKLKTGGQRKNNKILTLQYNFSFLYSKTWGSNRLSTLKWFWCIILQCYSPFPLHSGI